MKKFIITIVVFGVGLLGLAYVADYVISKNLRKSTKETLIGWNEIYSGNLQSDVVIMGNSRAWVQYSPQILDSILNVNSYNLSVDGSPINKQILKYDTYRRFNEKPKYIIQNIDILTIDLRAGYEREQFFPYFFDNILKIKSSDIEQWSWSEKHIPCYRYIGYTDLTRAVFGTKNLYPDDYVSVKGYCGVTLKWNGSNLIKQKEINYSQDTTALSLFDKYLSAAKSEDIKIIFVYAPIYIEGTKKIRNIDGMYAMYDSIAKKYDIPILDYNYSFISYDTAYFYNAMHLNKTGAELFSVKLAHDIDSLGILKKNF